jgi:gamma-glutamylputrescine oxidase
VATNRKGADPSIGYDESWYYATAKGLVQHPTLEENIDVDICIVGAGYTGLSAAIELASNGFSVAVLEKHRVGSGASGRNGGVLGMGQRKDQMELESWLGPDKAKLMWQIACDANDLVRDRISRFDIDCDLRDGELTVAHKPRYVKELWEYTDFLESRYEYEDHRKVSREECRELVGVDSFFGGYVDTRAGHIHPLNLALGMAKAATGLGVKIFENSNVESYSQTSTDKVLVTTSAGSVNARFMVIACNGYLGKLEKTVDRYQMPINNYVLATERMDPDLASNINRENLAIVDTRFVVNYFHNSPDHRLVFGGGETYSSNFPNDIKALVRRKMLEVYPQLKDVKIDYAWGGTLAITLRRMPHFGRKDTNIYWGQGYSGHGIAMANMGGKLIAEAIQGQADHFDLFANLKHVPFPGGRLLRWPALIAGMLYYSMLDKF